MEAQIDEALKGGDFYSAHQIILSVSQRKLKAQKIKDAKQVLITGATKLADAKQLMSTLDIANRLLNIVTEDASWKEDDYKCLCDMAHRIWTMDHEAAGHFVDSVVKQAENSAKFLTSFTQALIEDPLSKWEDFVNFAVLSGEPSLFSSENLVNKATFSTDIPFLIIQLLNGKNFAASTPLLSHLSPGQEVGVEDAAGSLPQALRNSDELSNLVQLLFVMAQRKGAPKSMFLEIKQHYAKILQDSPELTTLLTVFELVFWPSAVPKRQAQVNPMASMLQNLLSGVNEGM